MSNPAGIPQQAAPGALTFTLLRLLADREFHSGEVLAKRLEISRASVNNALRGLGDYGLTLHSVRGRGYRLANPPQWLDAARIGEHLGEDGKRLRIEILDSAPSSNTLLMQQAARGAPSGSVLAVEWQTGGRGRMGRTWCSGLGNALTFSLLWRFECGLAALSGLSLASGVALMRALRTLGVEGARLKWPNDALGARGKLAGILVEAQGDMLGPSAVVIGIGLNLSLPEPVLRQIGQPVTSLADLASPAPERNLLFAALLRELHGVLSGFARNGFAALREEWESYHGAQGQRVQLLSPDGSKMTGVALGVAEDGSLVLETPQGIRRFHAGEISLRSGERENAAD
ncbi:MAG: biotin--[acetyl-CoA-carboxylase] ligase [Nitrosomonadales bacterium]|nr:biotin--[acetyl-CoA-carboxylase] ligase [Nitrosomonadales bacterium]